MEKKNNQNTWRLDLSVLLQMVIKLLLHVVWYSRQIYFDGPGAVLVCLLYCCMTIVNS